MSIFYALRRILAKHFGFHMLIPLFFGAVAEVLSAAFGGRAIGQALTSLGVPVLGIVITYLVVMVLIIKREASAPYELANFTKVEEQLEDATSYFALCAIPMRDWFEPGAFKYFALLLWKKEQCKDFRYERVIIFPNPKQKREVEETTLDRYHAEALAKAHHMLDIPMGWLGPNDMREIRDGMREIVQVLPWDKRVLLERVPALLRWLPERVVKGFEWPLELDFAVVEQPNGPVVIIVPFRKLEVMVLRGSDTNPFVSLAKAIRNKVFDSRDRVRLGHDFPRLLGIG